MDLDKLEIDVGELVYLEDVCILRNEYAFIVFKLAKPNEITGVNCILINDKYYYVKTIEDLRTYKLEDFDSRHF